MKALERGGEVIRITIPDSSRHFLDRQITFLEEADGLLHPHPLEVLHGTGAEA